MFFTCAVCGLEFLKSRSDEEALAEMQQSFPGVTEEECETVCDHCFHTILFMNYDFPSSALN